MSIWKHHAKFERHSLLLVVGILLVVSIGGLVEIAPLFWLQGTIEKVQGVRTYTPLELAGRDIYVREGCYLCHSQMVRPLRDEVERYGHYSLAAESMYDHPFQWGSKRTGPDLARVGGKYSDPYTADQIANAKKDLEAQADPFSTDAVALRGRYDAKVVNRDFDGDPNKVTEMDALVAYLQMLGTTVDFKTYKAHAPENQR
ncbi:MAG: cytochrome-c oxidase, cbb3-type subunit II [Caulobacter vibrioides]|uniref:Cytochrome-c oxidase, cbb3-type subunit II n=1 Tax=Caulobacter vibrioides TaxID=155892 RepID=A0A258D8L8_CAUVI|nr:MAG: cytochrome-c oxidase, cbb3-type subunit II [Caulobacter vibrioides]